MQIVKMKKIIIPIFVILMIGLVFAQDICDTCIDDPAMCPPECFGAGFGEDGDGLLDDPLLNNPSSPGPVCGDGIIEEIEECETNSDCGANNECVNCACVLMQQDNDTIGQDINVTDGETLDEQVGNETDVISEDLENLPGDLDLNTNVDLVDEHDKQKEKNSILKLILLFGILVVVIIIIVIVYKIVTSSPH